MLEDGFSLFVAIITYRAQHSKQTNWELCVSNILHSLCYSLLLLLLLFFVRTFIVAVLHCDQIGGFFSGSKWAIEPILMMWVCIFEQFCANVVLWFVIFLLLKVWFHRESMNNNHNHNQKFNWYIFIYHMQWNVLRYAVFFRCI